MEKQAAVLIVLGLVLGAASDNYCMFTHEDGDIFDLSEYEDVRYSVSINATGIYTLTFAICGTPKNSPCPFGSPACIGTANGRLLSAGQYSSSTIKQAKGQDEDLHLYIVYKGGDYWPSTFGQLSTSLTIRCEGDSVDVEISPMTVTSFSMQGSQLHVELVGSAGCIEKGTGTSESSGGATSSASSGGATSSDAPSFPSSSEMEGDMLVCFFFAGCTALAVVSFLYCCCVGRIRRGQQQECKHNAFESLLSHSTPGGALAVSEPTSPYPAFMVAPASIYGYAPLPNSPVPPFEPYFYQPAQ